MIKTVQIKNYQGHNNTKIELCEGVNVIVGNNNTGKTAILRALNWLFFNRPSGGKIVNKSAGKTSDVYVGVDFYDGESAYLSKTVKTGKDGKKVVYSSEYSANGKKFSGFGNSVPDLVSYTMNMSEINIQDQLSGPFLVASSPGEIARTINRITKLDVSDDYIKSVNSLISSTNKELKVLVELENKAKISLNRYDGVDEVGVILNNIEECDNDLNSLESDSIGIIDIVDDIDESSVVISEYSRYADAYDIVLMAESIEKDIIRKGSDADEIGKYISISNIYDYILSYSGKINDIIDNADRIQYDINNLEIDADNLEYFIEIESDLSALYGLKSDAKSELSEYVKKENLCPLCFSVLDDKAVERMVGD